MQNNRNIDTDKFSQSLRAKALQIDSCRLLVTNLVGTEQETDLSVPPNCNGFGRIRHFHRETSQGWPTNPLPIVPACRALGVTSPKAMTAQVFQNAVCNWRCWYCYVPFSSLTGDLKSSAWLTATDLVDLFMAEPDRPRIIDLSGGQPDLIPEWVPWMMRALQEAGLSDDIYLWSDDNLSNDYLWKYLSDKDLNLIRNYRNYGRVCCFKGFDEDSFSFNTRAEPDLFRRQFELMKRLVEFGIDVYAYATFTSQVDNKIHEKMCKFVDALQGIHKNFPLRLVPLEIQVFNTVKGRNPTQIATALNNQQIAIEAWNQILVDRFSAEERSRDINDISIS